MNGLKFEVKIDNIERLFKLECIFYFFTNDKRFTLKKEMREAICKSIVDDNINYRIISGTNIHDPQFLKNTIKENGDIEYKFIFIDRTDNTFMILSDDIRDGIIDYIYEDKKESLDIVIPKIINTKIDSGD